MYPNEYKQGSTLAWIALLVGSLALIISVMAYNRSGKDLNDLVKETTNKTIDKTSEMTATIANTAPTAMANINETAVETKARVDLETKLIALKTKVAVNKADKEAANEVVKMRTDFDNAFVNANAEAKARAAITDEKLNQLENDLRAGTSNVLLSLESALESVRQNVTR